MDGQSILGVVLFHLVFILLLANQNLDRKCCAAETTSHSYSTIISTNGPAAPYELPQTSYRFLTTYQIGSGSKTSNPILNKHNYVRLVNNRINNDYSSDVYERSQFTSRARAAETSPLSIDLNRPGGPVGAELAKLLNLKQGYYSDLYDEITKPSYPTGSVTTKRPVEAFEEAIESAVVSALRGTRKK